MSEFYPVRKRAKGQSGSALLLALLTIVVLSVLAAGTMTAVVPKYHHTFQVAAWQEARIAADAGVDYAIGQLTRNVADPSSAATTWEGYEGTQWATTGTNGELVPVTNGVALQYSSSSNVSGNVKLSATMFLDNMPVIPSTGNNRPAVVDVAVSAVFPPEPDGSYDQESRWFRIRAVATAKMPGIVRGLMNSQDLSLRRLNIASVRATIQAQDFGAKQSDVVPVPSASRVIETLVRPKRAYDLALQSGSGGLVFGQSQNWIGDSWNSDVVLQYSDAPKASEGYAGQKCNIATLKNTSTAVTGGNYDVWGNAQTGAGGGTNGAIHGTVTDDFDATFTTPVAPTGGMLPISNTYTPGSNGGSQLYRVADSLDLNSMTIEAPTGGKGELVVVVPGDLTTSGGVFSLPTGVTLKLYVGGNINFGAGNDQINMDGKAINLQIYGTGSSGSISSAGTQDIKAVITAPTYSTNFKGTVDFYGAMVCYGFEIDGGGIGGFHYDESLANKGQVTGYEIASYFEDNRQ